MHVFLSYSVFALLFFTQTAFAQDIVSVRVGEHEGYSRVVFDLGGRVPYSATQDSQGRLTIKFDKAARVEGPPPKSNTALNIDGFEILSEDPLQVSLVIPDGSRTRNFLAGDRVVVDVYDPPGGKRERPVSPIPAAPKRVETPKPADVPQVKAQEESKKHEEEPHQESHKAPDAPALAAAPPPPVEQTEIPPPPEEELSVVADSSEPAAEPIKPNVITLSSTNSQGLAVFELNGNLWIVNDLSDLRLTPQVSGPDSEKLLPLQPVEIVGGRAFKTKILDGHNIRGQGGGLVWRVLLSPQEQSLEPARLSRSNVSGGPARSGKLIWPFNEAGKILDVQDPVSGAPLKIVTVKNSKLFAGPARDFVDFRLLNSPVGLAIMPKVDDLEVKITDKGVEVFRSGGLAVLTAEQAQEITESRTAEMQSKQAQAQAQALMPRVFDFRNWQMGGADALDENGAILLSEINAQTEAGRIEALVTLAKMYVSNAQGAEALGFLRIAQDDLPDLGKNPEFIALRGAAKALDWKNEPAFADLSVKELEPFEEIGYWRAFVLANLGDWEQAERVLPKNLDTLYDYPDLVFNRVALNIAEIALRSGNIQQAERLLFKIEENKKELFEPQVTALDYLKGEAARQRGKIDETKKIWEPLTTGKDDLYRAKAGLALTRLLVDQKELSPQKAIDRLERLRYAWRGDLLEAQINYWLGKTYFEADQYAKGLNILREAASFSAGTSLGENITQEMKDVFSQLFLSGGLEKVSPPDAAALYEQFSELIPTGDAGNKVAETLANHLVKADLLGRASNLLAHLLNHRLQGGEAQRVAVRLAAIYLLDNRPAEAMKVLSRATSELQKLPEEMQTQDKFLEISLLRARALSMNKRADQAMALLHDLPRTPAVNSLSADIAWSAGYWDDAAEALQNVILDRNFSLTRPLEDEDSTLLLHMAVALNLGGDRVALANMREKYSDAMAQTDKARAFEVVTRPRQSSTLASRETLMGIVSEVDLFSDFMKSYREPPAAEASGPVMEAEKPAAEDAAAPP